MNPEEIKNKVNEINGLVASGIVPEQAARIVLNQQDIIRIEAALFDELIKTAFLYGKLHQAQEIAGIAKETNEEALKNVVKVINDMI